MREDRAFPLLQLSLFRIRTFARRSAAASSPARHRRHAVPLAAALPGGLGFTPIQSGLLIMPQAMAAMSLK
jgi:hypothetical protein